VSLAALALATPLLSAAAPAQQAAQPAAGCPKPMPGRFAVMGTGSRGQGAATTPSAHLLEERWLPDGFPAIRWSGRQGVLILLATSFGLRLALAALMPPGYDEVYYFFYGRHIDLSFFDHPLAVGVWSWLGQRLGSSVLALRLPSVLSYTLALGLLAQATARWFGATARLWLLLLGNLCPLVLICGGVLLLPDSPLLLGLALLLWWIARQPQVLPRGPGQMLALAAILALITLSKYHALVVLPALLAWTLVRPDSRRLWLRWTSLGTVLAWGLLVSPLWLWNSRWGWVSFLFHSGRTTAAGGFNAEGSLLFLLSQLGLLFPTIGILLLAVLWPWRRAGALASEPAQLLRCLAWPQLVLFVLLAGRMQVMTSWLVPAWWISLPLAAAWLAQRPWGVPAVGWPCGVPPSPPPPSCRRCCCSAGCRCAGACWSAGCPPHPTPRRS